MQNSTLDAATVSKMSHAVVKVVLFTLVIFAGSKHKHNSASVPRIAGGYKTTIESHPYMVSLWRHGNFSCGGTLITPTCVLTAAHCVDKFPPQHLEVYGGSTMLDQGVVRKVQLRAVPTHYDPIDNDLDVAILKLEKPLKAPKARLVALDYSSLRTGEELIVAGWGIYDGINRSTHLRAVNTTVWSQSDCYRVYYAITENMFCAGDDKSEKDACVGDSGGPAMRKGKQVGIVSWGVKCGRHSNAHPGVYVRLSGEKVQRFVRLVKKLYC